MTQVEALVILEREREHGLRLAAEASSPEELDQAETAVLGRKAPFSEVQRSLGAMSEADRRVVGKAANDVRTALEAAIAGRRAVLQFEAEAALIDADRVDMSLPGRRPRPGTLHPLTIVEADIVEVFTRMGYRVAEGPEIEDDWHNFEALNIPRDHPARTMKDSLYVDVPD